jgi:hypothetical protein
LAAAKTRPLRGLGYAATDGAPNSAISYSNFGAPVDLWAPTNIPSQAVARVHGGAAIPREAKGALVGPIVQRGLDEVGVGAAGHLHLRAPPEALVALRSRRVVATAPREQPSAAEQQSEPEAEQGEGHDPHTRAGDAVDVHDRQRPDEQRATHEPDDDAERLSGALAWRLQFHRREVYAIKAARSLASSRGYRVSGGERAQA